MEQKNSIQQCLHLQRLINLHFKATKWCLHWAREFELGKETYSYFFGAQDLLDMQINTIKDIPWGRGTIGESIACYDQDKNRSAVLTDSTLIPKVGDCPFEPITENSIVRSIQFSKNPNDIPWWPIRDAIEEAYYRIEPLIRTNGISWDGLPFYKQLWDGNDLLDHFIAQEVTFAEGLDNLEIQRRQYIENIETAMREIQRKSNATDNINHPEHSWPFPLNDEPWENLSITFIAINDSDLKIEFKSKKRPPTKFSPEEIGLIGKRGGKTLLDLLLSHLDYPGKEKTRFTIQSMNTTNQQSFRATCSKISKFLKNMTGKEETPFQIIDNSRSERQLRCNLEYMLPDNIPWRDAYHSTHSPKRSVNDTSTLSTGINPKDEIIDRLDREN